MRMYNNTVFYFYIVLFIMFCSSSIWQKNYLCWLCQMLIIRICKNNEIVNCTNVQRMHTTSYYIRDDCPPEPKARVYISVEDKIGFINEYDTLLFTWIVKKLNSDFVSKCLRGLKFYCSSKNNDLCLFLRKGNSRNISSRMYLTLALFASANNISAFLPCLQNNSNVIHPLRPATSLENISG